MRRSVSLVAVGLTLVVGAAQPVTAGHNHHDHSSNTRLMSSTTIDWPFASDATVPSDNSGASVFYPGDFAFEGRLLVTAPQGRAAIDAPERTAESGLAVFRISMDRDALRQLSVIRCHAVGDVAVWGDLVLQGVVAMDTPPEPDDKCHRDGLRIYDVSDPKRPRVAAFKHLECGVGGFTPMKVERFLYVYVPSGCHESLDTPNNSGLGGEIFVFKVDLRDPRQTRMVGVGDILPQNGCGGTSIHQEKRLLVCIGDHRFVLVDVSDPANPTVLTDVPIVVQGSRWWLTSAAFSWDGQHLVVGLNGPTVPGEENPYRVQVWNIEDPTAPQLVGNWDAPPSTGSDAAAYTVSFLPMRDGRAVVLVAHANRGVRLVDFTQPGEPNEIAHYIPMDTSQTYAPLDEPSSVNLAYWYNGRFYAGDMDKIRVFKVRGFNRKTVHFFRRRSNPQTLAGLDR